MTCSFTMEKFWLWSKRKRNDNQVPRQLSKNTNNTSITRYLLLGSAQAIYEIIRFCNTQTKKPYLVNNNLQRAI